MQMVSRMKSDSVSSVQPGFTVLAGKRGYGNPSYVVSAQIFQFTTGAGFRQSLGVADLRAQDIIRQLVCTVRSEPRLK